MQEKSKSFASGAAMLSAAGLFCSALGAVFRLVIARTMGDTGMAFYQLAYPLYSLLTVVATVGIPAAISKQIAWYVARDDLRAAHGFFKTAWKALACVGALTGVLLAIGCGAIATMQGVPEGWGTILCMAPAVLLSFMISSLRGYFQGINNMRPTATSMIIEEVVKTALGLGLMFWFMDQGGLMMAVGALLGIPAAEAVACLFLALRYVWRKHKWHRAITQTPGGYPVPSTREHLKALWKLALPITISCAALPLISLLDNVLVINLMRSSGFSQALAQANFGLLSGIVAPTALIPMAFANALQMSLVPTVSASASLKRMGEVETQSQLAIKIALLIGVPCLAGLLSLGTPLLTMLFPATMGDANLAHTASQVMATMAFSVLALMVLQTTNGLLQGVGRTDIPVTHLWQGALIKVVVSVVLIRSDAFRLNGAAVGSLAAFLFMAVRNVRALTKLLKRHIFSWRQCWPPVIASLVMVAVSQAMYWLCWLFLPQWLCALLALLVAVATYGVAVLRLGLIGSAECRLLPFGMKLDATMHRIGWWR